MGQKPGKRTLYIILAVLFALIVVVAVFVFVRSQSTTPASDATESVTKDEPQVPDEAKNTETSALAEPKTEETTIDPELVSVATIEPMAIEVAYLKGIEGFEFAVLSNPNGTKYVQFISPKLVGSKCTNDTGVFASIIEEPTENEAATLTKKISVKDTTYGLSLTDSSCTNDEALLKQYQDAFSTPFTLLKKM